MPLQTYLSDFQGGIALFAGYTTTSLTAYPCGRFTTSMNAGLGTATPTAANPLGAIYKGMLRPVGGTFTTYTCASTIKIKLTANSSKSWYDCLSFALKTAFTNAQIVSGGTIKFTTACSNVRVFLEAYDSAGTRVASTLAGQWTNTSSQGNRTKATIVIPTTKKVTVPASGRMVLHFLAKPSTRPRCSFKFGKTATTPGLSWNPNIQPAGDPSEVRIRFADSTGNPYPDGTKVYEYDASTMQHTGVVATIGGAAVGPGATNPNVQPAATGVGEAVFTHSYNDTKEYFYVIPDPASNNVWAANTAYALGTRVNPASLKTLYAEVTTAGTSGATEPVWPKTKGATVTDGTVVWTMRQVETLATDAIQPYQLGFWQPNTAVVAGQDRIAPAAPGSYALCSTSGTTGATQPTWPTTWTSGVTTVADGTAVWTIYDDPVYE